MRKQTLLYLLYFLPLLGLSVGVLSAQTENEDDGDIVTLSPFQVDESENLGYFSAETLAGGRLSTNLSDVASSVQVVTMEFIEDIGATNLDEILAYTTGTEAVGTMNDYFQVQEVGTTGTIDQSQARQNPDDAIRIRGFAPPRLEQRITLNRQFRLTDTYPVVSISTEGRTHFFLDWGYLVGS